MIQEEKLTAIFKEVGAVFGYRNVSARFVNDPEMKVKWIRQGTTIQFMISDYLRNGSEFAIYSLAQTIFTRMSGDADAPYGEEFTSFVTSPDFLKENRVKYKSRNRGFHQPDQKIQDSIDRLVKKGYIKPLDKDTEVFYHDNLLVEPPKYKAAHGSPIFKVVNINSKCKTIEDPELMDYVVFKAVTQAQAEPFNNDSIREAMQKTQDYPNSMEYEARLVSDYALYNKRPDLRSKLMRKVRL